MKIVSFNVNGIRARIHQLEKLIDKHSPDIIGLQETKVDNENFPLETIKNLGYEVIINGQKGHYGDEAELVINASYVDGDVTVAAKGTDQDEMEVSVTFAF